MRGAALAALRDTIALRRAESPGDMTGTGEDVTTGTGEDVRPDVTASGDVRVSAAHVHQVILGLRHGSFGFKVGG